MSLQVSKGHLMAETSNLRTGGQILVDALKIHGVDTAFCVPGESYLAVLDALHDARDRSARSSAARKAARPYMAEAYGKLTGRPGICFVTRGPGATNASIGVHTAFQDSTPMILFIGQVGARPGRARGVPGDRLPPHVRPDGQMGGARSTTPRRIPEW